MRKETQPAEAVNDLDQRLAQRLAALRAAAGWSLDELAARTGISRATLSRLERGDTGPTTQLLARLCSAHGLTMSRLLADVEQAPVRLLRAKQQAAWRDKAAGFTRHMRAPPLAGFATELLEVQLAGGACIAYEAPVVQGLEHHLHLLEGELMLTLDGVPHRLLAGDTLSYKSLGASRFETAPGVPARYFLSLTSPR
jgi:transcriptional regulator with XRE-family HTH domain